MKKFFAAALVVSMLTVLLSGCMCQVADTTFQFDGSGTVEAKFGFSEEMVNAMNMRAEMTQNGFSYFRYDGHGYYGDQASESFANADEFNAIFAEVSAEIAEVSKAATPGTVTLSVASDGGLTLTVQNTQTDRRSAIKTELAKQLPDYSDAQINALLEDQRNVMIGIRNGQIVYVPFAKAVKHNKGIDRGALDLVKILSI